MARSSLIGLNPIELNYYPFMISLGKCNWICNAVDGLSTKICDPSQTKVIKDVRIYEAKTLIKHISFDC